MHVDDSLLRVIYFKYIYNFIKEVVLMKKLIKKSNEVANNLESYYDYAPGYFCSAGYCYCNDGGEGGYAPSDTVLTSQYNESYSSDHTGW